MKVLVLLSLLPLVLSAAGKPNVVLILSDDQAWNDYGFMGHRVIETPRLDRFAGESLTFTRGYVTAPLCRPSLASLFTGLHPHQHGITGNDLLDASTGKKADRSDPQGAVLHEQLYARLDGCPSIAKLLVDHGYLTLQTGKWWENDPKRFGFTRAMTHGDPQRGARHGDEGLKISREGLGPIPDFLDEAAKEKKPFFIWHAPFLPHQPHDPPQRLFAKYKAKTKSVHLARYHAMVEWFDETCGELFDELERRGIADDTMVIYVTDNGWIQADDKAAYAPLSKQDVHEGGVRTPIMVRWTGTVEPRMETRIPVSEIDIPVTILKAAGIEPPKGMSGIDLRDHAALAKRPAVFGADYSHDIRDVAHRTANLESTYLVSGPWKFIRHNPENFPPPVYGGTRNGMEWNRSGEDELYHLLEDPHEKRNLARERPGEIKRLGALLETWMNGFPGR